MLKIGKSERSGFDRPLALLSDCHRRIERFLYVLITVKRQAQGSSLTESQEKALKNALQYFREAAPNHTADEEESLFPRIRNHAKAELIREIERLESDHLEALSIHEVIDTLCTKWITNGNLTFDESAKLSDCLSILSRFYHTHIQIEDQVIFKQAEGLLNETEKREIGSEMAARRHVDAVQNLQS